MTITHYATSQDLTCEEIHAGFDALIKRIAELAAERDAAFQMAAQATKDLVRERRESEGQLKVRDALIDSLRINADRTNADVRRLSARVRELAVENEDLRARSERDQREPPTVRKNWRSRRIGNQL